MHELHQAVTNNQPDRVRELLQEGTEIDINLLDAHDATALHYAAILGYSACACILLDHGARKDIGGLSIGITPLQLIFISSSQGFRSRTIQPQDSNYPETLQVFMNHLTWVERHNLKTTPEGRAMGA